MAPKRLCDGSVREQNLHRKEERIGEKKRHTNSAATAFAPKIDECYLGADSNTFLLSKPVHEVTRPLLEIILSCHTGESRLIGHGNR